MFGHIDVGAGAKNVILNLRGVSQTQRAPELTLLLTCARTAAMQAALLSLSASAIDPTDVFQLIAEFEAFES